MERNIEFFCLFVAFLFCCFVSKTFGYSFVPPVETHLEALPVVEEEKLPPPMGGEEGECGRRVVSCLCMLGALSVLRGKKRKR